MITGELVQEVCDHLGGRPVTLRWQDPPTQSAVGEVTKSAGGDVIVYVSPNLTGVVSRLKTLLHELMHVRFDFDFVPVSLSHLMPSSSVVRSNTARQEWREDPREDRAKVFGELLFEYAEKNAWKFGRVGRDRIECMLLALLDLELEE